MIDKQQKTEKQEFVNSKEYLILLGFYNGLSFQAAQKEINAELIKYQLNRLKNQPI